MPRGQPITSPYVMTFGDYLADPATDVDPTQPAHAVRIQVDFDNTTHAITGATVWRSATCRWTKITLGVGTDKRPESSTFVFDLSALADASQTLTASEMAHPPYRVTTIDQFMSSQITAY
jgi:hypothetical protein